MDGLILRTLGLPFFSHDPHGKPKVRCCPFCVHDEGRE